MWMITSAQLHAIVDPCAVASQAFCAVAGHRARRLCTQCRQRLMKDARSCCPLLWLERLGRERSVVSQPQQCRPTLDPSTTEHRHCSSRSDKICLALVTLQAFTESMRGARVDLATYKTYDGANLEGRLQKQGSSTRTIKRCVLTIRRNRKVC